jgi:rare lipoprotein A
LPVNHALPLAALILLGACSGAQTRPHRQAMPPQPVSGPAADYPVVIGDPFVIEGRTWTPADTMNYDQVGYAAIGQDGGSTVSAAHRTLPLPCYVEITSLETGKTILVRLERRGPMRNDRLVELSPAAAAQLGASADNAPVRVRRVNPPEIERALLRSGQQAPARMDTPKALLGVLMRKLTGDAVPPAIPVPEPAATSAPAPKPAPPVRVRRPNPPAPVATASPTPSPATPAPIAAPSRPVAPAAGSLFVQAAAFSTKERADAAAAKLGAGVHPAGRLWRMQLGPFASQAEATAALAKAKAAGYSDARIVRGR